MSRKGRTVGFWRGKPIKSLEERFWEKVYVDANGGCWEWLACKHPFGYGILNLGGGQGKNITATHLSWNIFYGQIPEGMCILHKCDNPGCVRPDHLFLGTRADNIHDMMNKGRSRKARGEDQGKAKLTENQVREIRKSRLSCGVLAKAYGVSKNSILGVRHNKYWRHVI